jgi:peptidoglycan hydrolase-like protein with peptidoglycan-binding domain
LAANAPLAALADARPLVRPPIGDRDNRASPGSSQTPADFIRAASPGDWTGTGTFRIAADSTTPSQQAPAAQPPDASAASDKAAQENMFWESAQRSNSVADYKAYLDAFPNGVYAPLARNRIAAMSAQPAAAPPAAPPGNSAGGPPPGEPAPSAAALKAEVGTMQTEQSLNLAPEDHTELQQRLQALGLYTGPIDGNLGAGFRAAIGNWQRQHQLAPTGWLGPVQLQALKAESDAVAQQQPGGPGAPPAAGGPASSDKAAMESKFWDSAERSNSAADYQAYLQAFPNGLYAQMARNRIASLNNGSPPGGPGPGPGPGPGAPSAFGPPPQPVSPEALKAELGTVETEQQLDIGPPGRIELQQRLTAIGLYNGPMDGDLGPMARAAIAEWQKRHDIAPTGELGPLQLAALRIESEGAFEQFLASRPVVAAPVYAPVRRYYHPYAAAAPARNDAAPAVLGVLGGIALGVLGARLGGKFGGGGKGGGKGGGGKKKK